MRPVKKVAQKGAGAGLLAYIIRVFGGYPDGVAFAVLLMNLCGRGDKDIFAVAKHLGVEI